MILTPLILDGSFAPDRGFIFVGADPTTGVVGYYRSLLRSSGRRLGRRSAAVSRLWRPAAGTPAVNDHVRSFYSFAIADRYSQGCEFRCRLPSQPSRSSREALNGHAFRLATTAVTGVNGAAQYKVSPPSLVAAVCDRRFVEDCDNLGAHRAPLQDFCRLSTKFRHG